jgi:hypothetical protein
MLDSPLSFFASLRSVQNDRGESNTVEGGTQTEQGDCFQSPCWGRSA